MKTSTALLAFILATQSSATELLTNGSFEALGFGWKSLLKYNPLDAVSYEETYPGAGIDACFRLRDGGVYKYDAQMIQTRLQIRPGYRYTLHIGGKSTAGTYKAISVGIQHNGGESILDGDQSNIWTEYYSVAALFTSYYDEFTGSWDNCTETDDVVQFYIQAGGDANDAEVAWVSLGESPIDCGGMGTDAGVRMNQVGFVNQGSKKAVILRGTDDPIEIKNAAGNTVLTQQLGPATFWEPSGEVVRQLDFSSLETSGRYELYQNGSAIGDEFVVAPNILEDVLKASLKFFYYQRASTTLPTSYAGMYSRASGHDDARISKVYAGETGSLSSPKGWYDAGDYGKYVVNSGITTRTLLALYEHYSSRFDNMTWNLPESQNGKPDLLDEIKWNLDWMLTMQDPADGGVYHKLTTAQFSGMVMPALDTSAHFVFMKTTNAAYDFAAVMAASGRIFASTNASYAANCLAAARKAYAWAEVHPETYFEQPLGVNTGEYGDDYAEDEHFWAASELYLTTRETRFLSDLQALDISASTPDWASVGMLGYYNLALHPKIFPQDAARAKDSILRVASDLRQRAETSGYGVSIQTPDFVWGSNAIVANQGIALLHAYYLTDDLKYRDAAQQQLGYLLGQNPNNMSYLTGFGARSPAHPHHRPSIADNVVPPVPGMLVGGPHNGGEDIDKYNCSSYLSPSPALSYHDNACSFATNEVAINWNAAFAYLAGSIDALATGNPFTGGDPISVATRPASDRITTPITRLVCDGRMVRVQKLDSHGKLLGERGLEGRRIP